MFAELGSSPLARGLRPQRSTPRPGRRIIPARAGFTCRRRQRRDRRWDHPRSRGVYRSRDSVCSAFAGSSPLARGLRARNAQGVRRGGIIPARAGFTAAEGASRPRRQDHPRSRGVYVGALTRLRRQGGSSPLARGLPEPVSPQGRVNGIIPARVGFTTPGPSHRSSPRDHPRSRGVYFWRSSRYSARLGSSPLARGLHLRGHGPERRHRIIPARAGFTRPCVSPPQPPSDHPRSRGVYATAHDDHGLHDGSSPLARGLPCGRRGSGPRGGIIPARAGFT